MGMLKKSFVVALAAIALWCLLGGQKFDPESLRGKRVIVTGSSTGIGEQLAYHYSRFGAKVIITARRIDKLKEVAETCRSLGAQQVEVVQADMNFRENRLKVIQAAKDKFGGLDVLVINHVILEPGLWHGNVENMTNFRKTLEVGFVSYVDLASHALPLLEESKGNLGVISSVSGHIPVPNLASYSASKFALEGFFRSLRQDLVIREKDVSVSIAVLGLIGTEAALSYVKHQNMDSISAASPDSTALAIIEGISTRAYTIYYPRLAKFYVGIHKLFPNLFESYILKFHSGKVS